MKPMSQGFDPLAKEAGVGMVSMMAGGLLASGGNIDSLGPNSELKPLKMFDPWKRRFVLETTIFRCELLVVGSIPISNEHQVVGTEVMANNKHLFSCGIHHNSTIDGLWRLLPNDVFQVIAPFLGGRC